MAVPAPDPGVVADWDELATAILGVSFEAGAPTGSSADWSRGWYLSAEGRRYVLTVHVHGESADAFVLSAMGDAEIARRIGDETARGRADASLHWRFRNVNVGLTREDVPTFPVQGPIWEELFSLSRPIQAFLERHLVDDLRLHRPSIRFATPLPERGHLGAVVRSTFSIEGVDAADLSFETSHPPVGRELFLQLHRPGAVSVSFRASNRRTLISAYFHHVIHVTASFSLPRLARATRLQPGRLDGDAHPIVVLQARPDGRVEHRAVLVIDLDGGQWLLIEARVQGGSVVMSNMAARIAGLRVLLFEDASHWRWLESTMFALEVHERFVAPGIRSLGITGTFAIGGLDWTLAPDPDARSARNLLLERLRGTAITLRDVTITKNPVD